MLRTYKTQFYDVASDMIEMETSAGGSLGVVGGGALAAARCRWAMRTARPHAGAWRSRLPARPAPGCGDLSRAPGGRGARGAHPGPLLSAIVRAAHAGGSPKAAAASRTSAVTRSAKDDVLSERKQTGTRHTCPVTSPVPPNGGYTLRGR